MWTRPSGSDTPYLCCGEGNTLNVDNWNSDPTPKHHKHTVTQQIGPAKNPTGAGVLHGTHRYNPATPSVVAMY